MFWSENIEGFFHFVLNIVMGAITELYTTMQLPA